MSDCSKCEGSGWKPVMVDGVRRVVRCDCLVREKAAEEKTHPGGFRSLAELVRANPKIKDLLRPDDERVAEFLETRRGKEQAVTSKEIASHLWPGTTMDNGWSERKRRDVCACIERLRTIAKMPIAASKEPPLGYFMPATAEETAEMFERCVQEILKGWKIARLFRPGADLVRELEGQLKLQDLGSGIQDSDSVIPAQAGIQSREAR